MTTVTGPENFSMRLRFAIPLIGWLQIGIALFVLVSWAARDPILAQLDPGYAPMHFNAAVALFLWGAGLLSLLRHWSTLTRSMGGALVALCILSMAHNSGFVNWGLGCWALPQEHSHASFPPSGLGMPDILTFAVAGFVLILMTYPERFPGQSLLFAFCGIFLFAGSIAALVGQQVAVDEGNSLGPPLLGVFGSMLGGLAALLFSVRTGLGRVRFGHALPLFVGFGGILFSLVLWQALNGQQSQRMRRTVQIESAHVHRVLEEALPIRMQALNEMSARLREAPDDLTRIGSISSSFVARQPGCLGIARVDAAGVVQWIETAGNNRVPETLTEVGVEETMRISFVNGKTAVRRAPRSKWNGTRVLILYAPIDPGSPAEGGLIAVIKLHELFDSILNVNVAPGYALAIKDQDEPLYGRYATEMRFQESLQQSLPVRFQDTRWTLHVWPTSDVMSRESLSLPKLALAVGLLTTILLAMAVHLAQTARRRARELEKEMHERVQAEGALKQSEAKYRTLIENLEQGVFLKDRNGRYVAANRVFCRGVALSENEVIGRTDEELCAASAGYKLGAEDRQVLEDGKRIENEEERKVDGQTRVVRRILTPVRDANGQPVGVLGICWDVTEQRLIESRLRQTGKMDAIGQLAGGVAHDFNNLLTAILGNLDLMLPTLSEGERNHELVVAAQHAAVRAASLTKQLLGFSRQHQLDWEPTDLNGIIDEVVTLLGRTIDPRIRIDTRKSPECAAVLGDSSQLNQVIMNLCLNARDAMAGPGQIRIETECVEVTEMQALDQADARVGDFVRMRISDTGSGMSTEVRARIFEPFFTTKEFGKGTGLGLAMVFAIIKAHQGWIECQSEVGYGTRFDIYLPKTAQAVRSTPPPVPVVEPERQDSATILVVDDEPMIRKLAVLVLERNGFEVIEAEDGQQAVEIYERELDRIDLVLMDLTMPNLSGQEALRQMWQVNPDVKALFASGYAAEQITLEEQRRILGFVKKPYRPNELLQTIREALKRVRHPDSSHDILLVGCEG